MMIFLEYLKISLWMSPIILLALWLLPKVSGRYTAKLAYFVWLVIALRLIVPWNLTLPTAPIQVEIPQERIVQWVPMDLEQPAEKAEQNLTQQEKEIAALAEMERPAAKESGVPTLQAVSGIWLAGAAVFLLRTAVSTYQLKKLLKRWEKEPSQETEKFYAETAGEKRPSLAVCPALETPMAAGLFHTKIYLPHEEYSRQEMEMIFRHELIHWRRKDLWYKFLLLLARSIDWCNPCVWFMAKRANRDLEISCDGEVVKEKDMAYRKAYSLMILQEAERGVQKQAALTTCFTDGKKALQERLVEILNGEKRKRGMALVAMTLILALTCGCLVSYGGADKGGELLVQMAKNGILTEEQQEMVRLWAEALSIRDGKIRYDMMGEDAKAQFEAEQKAVQGEEWDFNIGGSSPWVVSYEVEEKENAAIITYTMQDSTPQFYTMKELLKFGEENGKTVVESYLISNLYWEDGKVYPVISKAGVELDEGIWDFMYQSVVGFISQSKWQIYELEAYNFNIVNVERKRLENGRDEVTVDFGLQIVHHNHFCDPAETSYLKKVKEQGRKDYEFLYQEYYKQQESNTYMRFTCEVLPDAAKIYEDTCYPDTFRLYNDDGNPHKILFEKEYPAYEAYYDTKPSDGWYCKLQPFSSMDRIIASRKILINDVSGRTNNGYFLLNTGYGADLTVAEDAEIYIGGAGEELQQIGVGEWMEMLLEESLTTGKQRTFTLWFAEKADGNFEIVKAREGFWTAKAETPKEKRASVNIPSGYPTDSRNITTKFAMWHPVKQHTGMDFSTDNKNIPVYATADGIILEAAFDAKNGNYVKINHLNGYTTLYAHLSELDVKAGDKVAKGDILGLTGKTGMATGIHCHYEIQLNGIYQDPANYL